MVEEKLAAKSARGEGYQKNFAAERPFVGERARSLQ
jgi:hypothetical protein